MHKLCPLSEGLFLLMGWNVLAIIVIEQPPNALWGNVASTKWCLFFVSNIGSHQSFSIVYLSD